jgi:hypothetical protein
LRRGPSSSYDSPNWRRGKAKSLDGSRQRAHHPPSSARLCAAKSFRDRVAEKENAAGGGEHEGRVKPGPSLVQCASFAHAPASPPSHARLFGLAAECLVEQGPIISALLRQCGMGPAPLAGEQVWRHATRRRRCDRSKVFVGREGAATTEDWTHKAARESPVGRQLRGATAQPPGGAPPRPPVRWGREGWGGVVSDCAHPGRSRGGASRAHARTSTAAPSGKAWLAQAIN